MCLRPALPTALPTVVVRLLVGLSRFREVEGGGFMALDHVREVRPIPLLDTAPMAVAVLLGELADGAALEKNAR